MRLRDPKDKIAQLKPQFNLDQTLQDLDQQAAQQEEEKWHKYKIEVITPIFGGGIKAGKPDTKMPIRASAIRGQLRYWWRFLESANRDLTDREEQKRLFRDEREIWGGMAEEGEDHSSKVRLRIENVTSHVTPQPYNEGGAPYALFPARAQRNPPRDARELIWPKVTFDLKVHILDDKISEEEDQKSIKRALRWWATFGGIGARTRRGCGSVYCAELFNDEEIKEEVEAAGCELVFPEKYDPSNPILAWKKAIERLYNFRQGISTGRNGSYRKHGRSKWPEPDSIRLIMGTYSEERPGTRCNTHKPKRAPNDIAFPRAAFGLPIIFKFKDEYCGDPKQTELTPFDGERLASPLILTPYPIHTEGSVKYVPAALLIGNRQHIKDMKLSLVLSKDTKKERRLHPEKKKGEWRRNKWDQWPNDWNNKTKMQDVTPITNNGNTDALTAFMNFFASGGK